MITLITLTLEVITLITLTLEVIPLITLTLEVIPLITLTLETAHQLTMDLRVETLDLVKVRLTTALDQENPDQESLDQVIPDLSQVNPDQPLVLIPQAKSLLVDLDPQENHLVKRLVLLARSKKSPLVETAKLVDKDHVLLMHPILPRTSA